MILLFEQDEAIRRYGNRMRAKGEAKGINKGMVIAYADMIADGALTTEKAAQKMNMSVDEFEEAVRLCHTPQA